MQLSEADFAKVREAIAAAEKETSAEIFAVLAERSGEYRFAGYFLVLLAILIGGFIVALGAWWRWIEIPLVDFAGAELALAITAMLFVRFFPQIGLWLVPRNVRHELAHANAARQFLAHGIGTTRGRTGVLVFVSLAERYGEIIADEAIAQRFGQAFWDDTLTKLIERARAGDVADGYVTAIATIGERLKKDFPLAEDDVNELEDRLVIL